MNQIWLLLLLLSSCTHCHTEVWVAVGLFADGPVDQAAMKKAGMNIGKTIAKEVGKAVVGAAARAAGNVIKRGVQGVASSIAGMFSNKPTRK